MKLCLSPDQCLAEPQGQSFAKVHTKDSPAAHALRNHELKDWKFKFCSTGRSNRRSRDIQGYFGICPCERNWQLDAFLLHFCLHSASSTIFGSVPEFDQRLPGTSGSSFRSSSRSGETSLSSCTANSFGDEVWHFAAANPRNPWQMWRVMFRCKTMVFPMKTQWGLD